MTIMDAHQANKLLAESGTEAMHRRILKEFIKPAFQQTNWDADTVSVLETIILSLTYSDDLFGLLVPPVMTLIDHHDATYKTTGAKLLHHAISTATPTRLRGADIYLVFRKSLIDTSRWIDSPELMLQSILALVELKKAYIKESPEYYAFLEEIMEECVLRNYIYATKVPATQILVQTATTLIPLLEINTFTYMNQLVDVAVESMLICELTHLSLNLLVVLTSYCWAGMDTVASKVLVALAECWRLRHGDQNELRKVARLLACAQVKRDAQVLLHLDEGLYKGLVRDLVASEI
jgi:Tti2 family